MKLSTGQKLLMIGDSITDCGRVRPLAEGPGAALGGGYVGLVDALLASVYPALGIKVVNAGCSGHTVRDLAERWTADVTDQKPDWVSIMIGTNDVWRQFDNAANPQSHVYPDEYQATLRRLIEQTKPAVKGMVVLTPFFVEPNKRDPMRMMMDQYGAMAKAIAAENGLPWVDTQAAFDAVMPHVQPALLAADRVHPTLAGHMTLARAFLQSIGFAW